MVPDTELDAYDVSPGVAVELWRVVEMVYVDTCDGAAAPVDVDGSKLDELELKYPLNTLVAVLACELSAEV